VNVKVKITQLGFMKNNFVRQARLPKAAYNEAVFDRGIGYFMKRSQEEMLSKCKCANKFIECLNCANADHDEHCQDEEKQYHQCTGKTNFGRCITDVKESQREYSTRVFGQILCWNCQKAFKSK
jgi:hypothetical protein